MKREAEEKLKVQNQERIQTAKANELKEEV